MISKHKDWLAGTVLLFVLAAAGWWLMNRGYGETSQEGYRYAVALFTACNQKDEAKLQQISTMITDSLEAGSIEPVESKWLLAIIDQGLAGKWEAASREIRKLMEDQQQPA